MTLSKAVETAIKMETDAMTFYREAVGKTSHPFAKKMFQGFVADEVRHLKMLQDLMNDLDIDMKVHPDINIKTVFSELKDEMMDRVKATSNEMDAIKIAVDFEKAGYDFYKKSAEEAEGEMEKKLFKALAAEEEKHYELLDNTYRFLEDTGEWFMWEEHGILEG